jgi:hypothetical protein
MVEHFDIGPLHNFPEKVIERLQNVKKISWMPERLRTQAYRSSGQRHGYD